MKHGTIRNNEKYCDISAVNACTHIQLMQLILTTARGSIVYCYVRQCLASDNSVSNQLEGKGASVHLYYIQYFS